MLQIDVEITMMRCNGDGSIRNVVSVLETEQTRVRRSRFNSDRRPYGEPDREECTAAEEKGIPLAHEHERLG
jgi:hypothetical protein